MSDVMRPIPFAQVMDWILTEHDTQASIFGVRKAYRHEGGAEPIFAEKIETPFGPAAGPNTQLAQNIVASYVAGSRFFELKTVQIMDGEELSACVNKPCIVAEDECYNCEWSTELTVPQAFAEYVKAWWACKLIAREYGLGDPDGFVFNMSVGYSLEGIKSEKVDKYIEGMKDASGTEVWAECRDWALANLDRFANVDADFVNSVSPAGLQLRHRVHAPRLPARRDRAHRHLPHHREGREHLHQVQPDAAGLRLRPRPPQRAGL